MSGAKKIVMREGVLEILPFLYKEFIICNRLVLFLHFSTQLVWVALGWPITESVLVAGIYNW